jgi:predicted phosphodiesterase
MMGRNKMQVNKLTEDAILKFPELSKTSIARYLFATYPTHFNTIENARSMVRKLTGAQGDGRRKYKQVEHTPAVETQFNLPKSIGKTRIFYQLDKSIKNALILSDIHFPNHDEEALRNALIYGKENNIDCIILNGDILDNEPFTNHDAPPQKLTAVADWFNMVDDFLDMLIREFNVPIHWTEGNHDNWYKRWLMKKAPILFNDAYYTMSSRLKLREKGIKFHDQNVIFMAGKLPITHGHLLVRGAFSPVNPSKGIFNKLKGSMLIGHCHQTSEHSESLLDGTLITTYSTGCLCTLTPDYDPVNLRHNLGFARVEIKENGNYKVHNKRMDYFTKQIY